MAGLDNDLESVIVDLSRTPLNELSVLSDEAIAAVVGCVGDSSDTSSRLWDRDGVSPVGDAQGVNDHASADGV